MEIRQLTYFAAVVEEGTVTGAAKRLNMTQPPLTAQLHALENELGCALFSREGRRLRLTEAGHAFYQRAQTILGLCDAAQGELAEYRQGTAGTLRLGVVSSVSSTVFLTWLGRFSAQYPAVRYDLSAGDTYQLLRRLGAGEIDIAFVRTPFSAPELATLPLRRETMLAVGQPCFFAELSGKSLSIAALAQAPLILYRRWESLLRSRFEAAGCTLRVFCRNEDAQTTLALAQSGFGVGILPASALPAEARKTLVVREIDDAGLTTEIAAVCRAEKLLPRCARLFWQSLRGA